jgi:uncharacterized membrane protein YhaH (DUF805 family)
MSDEPFRPPPSRGRPKPSSQNWLDGRANRKEYWLFVAPLLALSVGLTLSPVPEAHYVPDLIVFLVWIRRLHDIGWSGFIAPLINIAVRLLGFGLKAVMAVDSAAMLNAVVALGVVALLGAIPGEPRNNRYGGSGSHKRGVAEVFS